MNKNLLAFGVQEHQLIIAGNESADIMEVLLMDMFEHGVQETTYSENVYLPPEMVNPSATLKAAAAILEHHGLCKGTQSGMNPTIEALARQVPHSRPRGFSHHHCLRLGCPSSSRKIL